MNTIQNIYFAFWILLLPFIPVLILYYRGRFRHPIKGRFPRLALMQALLLWFYGTYIWLKEWYPPDCLASDFGVILFSHVFLWIFNYRLLQLFFLYKITQDIADIKDLRNWEPNWFTRNRYLLRPAFAIKAFFFLLALYMLIYPLYHFTGLACTPQSEFVHNGIAGLWVILSLCFAYQMWNFPQDAFGMKAEYRDVTLTIIGSIMLLLILSFTTPQLSFLPDLSVAIIPHLVLVLCILIPVWKAYIGKQGEQQEAIKKLTLEAWLSRPDGPKIFLDYLRLEFSTENLRFWLEVNDYKRLDVIEDKELIRERALRIFSQFIAPEAPCLLNLPDTISTTVRKAISIAFSFTPLPTSRTSPMPLTSRGSHMLLTESPSISTRPSLNPISPSSTSSSPELSPHSRRLEFSPDLDPTCLQIFDEAQEEIYRLMASDSFARFQRSFMYSEASKLEAPSGRVSSAEDPTAEVELLIVQQNSRAAALSSSASGRDYLISGESVQ